ncbi:hypothetical protein NBRC110019_07420 [Neptunitalea chrysea]|uniref:DUF6046 domain-containing protein n=1 Tax=Neptunitalea chrysea TaxID=1647581 RepID=A0A9W6B6N3_9FLAO|nr:DUF6046 domain-containing protein [Neptunitalea chrysea]GLB51703.1 hypothetical protein NBRC110019_07420 [Neptunitalea chrysea]
MGISYNIRDLFLDAFGVAPVFTIPNDTPSSPELNYSDIVRLPEYYDRSMTSWMGTPILLPVKFQQDGYNRYTALGKMEIVRMPDYYLPATTMFSFRRGKIIERTNLLGNNGSVKEIFSFDDWVIDVKGLCLNDQESSAAEKFKELKKWEVLADSIRISGEAFNWIEVDSVTIADWSHNLIQGGDGNIAFQFQMYSDESKDQVQWPMQ